MAKTNRDKVIGKLKKVSIFCNLSKKELQSISKLMTQINVPKGRVLLKQGTLGSDFLVIIKGKASVRRNNRKLADLGAGNFIGELAILSGAPRTATVTAETDMVLEVLSRREFLSLLDKSPKLTKNILMSAIKRLQFLDRSNTS